MRALNYNILRITCTQCDQNSPISLRSTASGSVGGRSYTPKTSVCVSSVYEKWLCFYVRAIYRILKILTQGMWRQESAWDNLTIKIKQRFQGYASWNETNSSVSWLVHKLLTMLTICITFFDIHLAKYIYEEIMCCSWVRFTYMQQ